MERGGGSSDSCYYSILGVRRDASFSDVRVAYLKLAMKWHPDRCMKNQLSADEAKQSFQKIQEAYSVLSDRLKRAMYNAGMLKWYEGEDNEENKKFMRELFSGVDPQQKNKVSVDDVQKLFKKIFGEDFAKRAAGKDPKGFRASSHRR